MKQQLNNHLETEPYNKSVREAYYTIYRKAKQLLATLQREEMRYSLEREDRVSKPNTIVHEFINPLLYLRLETDKANTLIIHFGIEQVLANNQYSQLTAIFIRELFRLTAKEHTAINIEQCVNTDWMINTPSAMYEHVESRNKHHAFKQIAYKPATIKRKAVMAVA